MSEKKIDNLHLEKAVDEEVALGDEALAVAMDERIIWFMHFIKKQIMAESIDHEAITPPQFGLLYCLCHRGQTTMTTLSQEMHLTHGASTGMVDRLIKLKLVERMRSETDRRVVYVSITERGQELIERMRVRRHAILKNIIKSLTNEERKLFIKVNTLFKEKLDKYVE
jgi:MarR family transcriptional regulator, organic hydroperoxide resistance regulator